MIDLNLKERVVVVTGGSRGIGRATAEAFAQIGAHVVINYLSDEVAARETVSAAELLGVKALAVAGDVRSVPDAQTHVKVAGRLECSGTLRLRGAKTTFRKRYLEAS